MKGFVVVEGGPAIEGRWRGGSEKAGEMVFNTTHSGYEEVATDPSYFNQIMVMSSPHQGNYGFANKRWESSRIWLNGVVCLEMENGQTEFPSWSGALDESDIPIIDEVDTRTLILNLRDHGTRWGALVRANSKSEAQEKANQLIEKTRSKEKDWCFQVSSKSIEKREGKIANGPRVALLDFGCKENIVRELVDRCSEVTIFPSRSSADEIMAMNPDGLMLSNGPGSPENVIDSVQTIKSLLGRLPIFGICMGHQLLGLALGGTTSPLKFGHRGANHPVKNLKNDSVYMTSQNHGYIVDGDSLPSSVQKTHINLNDNTLAGIESLEHKCFSLQFHPENHPGPREAEKYFDQFIDGMKK